MDTPALVGVCGLRQLETLLDALVRDETLIAGLSLTERQQLEGACTVVHSLLAPQFALQTPLPDERK
jgi:hypothetical protein